MNYGEDFRADPEPGLTGEQLPGDLILYLAASGVGGVEEEISRAVGAGQFVLGVGKGLQVYSHVAWKAWTPRFQWEATFPWVGCYPIDIRRPYEVWRLPDLTPDKIRGILRECAQHKGDLYNLLGLFTAGRFSWRGSEVCSQFVDIVARSQGYVFDREGLRLLAPDAIVDYPGLTCVGRYSPPKETV